MNSLELTAADRETLTRAQGQVRNFLDALREQRVREGYVNAYPESIFIPHSLALNERVGVALYLWLRDELGIKGKEYRIGRRYYLCGEYGISLWPERCMDMY